MSHSCKNHPDRYCYICGEILFAKQRTTITNNIVKAYELYFGCKLGDQDKSWAPHFTCSTCAANLNIWLKDGSRHPSFGVPMIWREPKNHLDDCYFCCHSTYGVNKRAKVNLKYPNLDSARRPIPHSSDLPIPVSPSVHEQERSRSTSPEALCSNDNDLEYGPSTTQANLSENDLHDLSRNLLLTKQGSELLASRLKEINVLSPETRITSFRKRGDRFQRWFSHRNGITYCSNVAQLLCELDFPISAENYRIFIDSGKSSLKAVLLHNGNQIPSIPIGYSLTETETYSCFKNLLQLISYENFQWKICADFKVIGLLMGLQSGYTKHPCFLCEWDSRARTHHFIVKQWPERVRYEIGHKNVVNQPLVDPKNIILPPLHIKLGLCKNFVKAIRENEGAINYLVKLFPAMSVNKIKEGIFIGPQIKQLISDTGFKSMLSKKEQIAWESFVGLTQNFLGNHKSPNYQDLVKNFLESFQAIGSNMSIKIHYLDSHLDFFPENLGAMSDEHGELFHQKLSLFEKRFNKTQVSNMLGDFCWTLVSHNSKFDHRRAK